MKTKTGEIPLVDRQYMNHCEDMTRLLEAALEELARRYSIMFPWKNQRARRVFEKVTIKFVKEKARKNIKRGKK